MRRITIRGAVLAGLLLLGLPARAEDKPAAKPDGGVSVLCEVWSTADAALVKELEALTAKNPADAQAILSRLQQAGAQAGRACRFQTPTTWGTPMKHDDSSQVAVTAPARTTGGRARGGFGGFMQNGTKLTLTATEEKDGQISIQLTAKITGTIGQAQAGGGGVLVPPGRSSVSIDGTVKAASGVTRVFQSNTHKAHTTFVFVTATRL